VLSTPTATGASNATDSGAVRTATTGHRLRTASVPHTEPNTSSANRPEPSLPSTTIVHVGSGNHGNFIDYRLRVGIHFEHGIYYKGKVHPHWAHCRYDARYGCDCYWDPCSLTWYYWCEPDLCYYPVTYVPYRTYSWRPAVVLGPVGFVSPGAVLPAAGITPVGEIPAIPAPLAFQP